MATRQLLAPVHVNGSAVPGITANRTGPVRDILRRATDGQFHPTFQADRRRHGACEFKTLAISTLLAALNGSTDLPAVKGNGSTGYQGYFGKLDDGLPAFAAGSVHELRTAAYGTLWMSSLDWQEGGDAEATVNGLFYSNDGTTEPIVPTAAALPTIPANSLVFDLSALTLNGASEVDVTSLSLRFDPKFTTKRHPASILARSVLSDGNAIDSSLTLGIANLASMRGLTQAGATGSLAFTLTSRAQSGGLGSTTVTFTGNGRWALPEDESAAVGSEAGGQVLFIPRYDGSSKPWTWLVA